MSPNQKRALAIASGACSVAAGYAGYRKAKKWDWESAASVIGGVVMIVGAITN
jgi:hypothetical protein